MSEHSGAHRSSSVRWVRRILVIKNRAIGDTILTTGSLRLLKRYFPNHQIHVLVRSPAGQLLEGLPYVDRVISTLEPKGKVDRAAYWLRLVRRLREKRYDLVLNFHASFRTALTAKMLRATECVANHHELKGRNWFSDRVVPGRGVVKSVIERDLDLLRALGIQADVADALPEIVLSPLEKAEASALFASGEFAPERGRPRVFLGVGGSRPTKRWPARHFAEVVSRLARESDAVFVLATVPEDQPWLADFWRMIQSLSQQDPGLERRILHFAAVPLRQTAKIISQCDVYVGNDSGLKHLAVALGLRTFTIFGPESPLEWHPYDSTMHPYAYIEGLACRTETGKHWCSLEVCREHGSKCTQDILPEQIGPEVARIIGMRGPK